MKRTLFLLAFIASVGCIFAQGPNGSGTYYQNANGKKGEALKTALCSIINKHTKIGYDGLYEAYKKTDTRVDGYVRDWYSKTTKYKHVTDKAGSYSKEGDCYNREHSVPQSWFETHGSKEIIVCDIVHVLPTDGYVNNRRSNFPFGEVSTITYKSNQGYCKLGSCKTSGYSGTVFEPGNDIKGDLARAYFYMATCYQKLAPQWGHDVFTGTTYQPFSTWTYNMLMRWAKEDPIDDIEIARNNAVYETQNNRNPFVDYPGLEDYVWGDKKDVAFSYDQYESGGGSGVVTVAMPVFSPDEGTYYNKVEVSLSCATADAVIYYTTNGDEPTEDDYIYEGPFELTETSTVKAIAVKDGVKSYRATATYNIQQTGGGDSPIGGDISINNNLFNTSFNEPVLSGQNLTTYKGEQNGVTVTYAVGSGSNQYISNSEIRIYKGNTLTLSVQQGQISKIVFTLGSKSGTISASTGTMSGATWNGHASTVQFTVSSRTDISKLNVSVTGVTGMDGIRLDNMLDGKRVIYNLRGQRVAHPTHGLYIVDGKKVYIP